MAKTYYIYEIPGVKVGCTTDLERRQKQQRDKGDMILLESYTDINKASERERELQLEKGYPIIEKWDYITSVINSSTVCQSKEAIKKRVANTDWKDLGKQTSKRQRGIKPKHLHTKEVRAKAGKSISKALTGRKCKNLWKAIYAYKDGKEYYFESLTAAAKFIEGNTGSICSTLKGKYNHYKGYTFRYA